MPSDNRFVSLAECCSLRELEKPCVYNRATDELYELDREGCDFLRSCDGTRRLGELGGEPEFVEFCFREGILHALAGPHKRRIAAGRPPAHSLRYLELHITSNCNLRCAHCYLAADGGPDMEISSALGVIGEFDEMQGLRLLVSGGEPLMHPGFRELNERLRDFGFRSVLMTNGTLITRETARMLRAHEVQISIDGMQQAHDALRGPGSFAKAVRAVELVQAEGIRVSVATTINALNAGDFGELAGLVGSLSVAEWNVDVPSVSGRLAVNPAYALTPREAAPYMSYGFGGGHHGGSEGFACGSHLCVVGADGSVAKCGFYLDSPVGNVSEGLAACWGRIRQVRLSELSCDCEFVEDCKGGCRFRAEAFGGFFGPDPVRCHNLGVMSG